VSLPLKKSQSHRDWSRSLPNSLRKQSELEDWSIGLRDNPSFRISAIWTYLEVQLRGALLLQLASRPNLGQLLLLNCGRQDWRKFQILYQDTAFHTVQLYITVPDLSQLSSAWKFSHQVRNAWFRNYRQRVSGFMRTFDRLNCTIFYAAKLLQLSSPTLSARETIAPQTSDRPLRFPEVNIGSATQHRTFLRASQFRSLPETELCCWICQFFISQLYFFWLLFFYNSSNYSGFWGNCNYSLLNVVSCVFSLNLCISNEGNQYLLFEYECRLFFK